MKKIFSFIILFMAGIAIHSCSKEDPFSKGATLVQIDNQKITEGYLEFLSEINPSIARQMSNPFGKKQILDNLVGQELLYQAAQKANLHKDPQVMAKMDLYKKVILAQSYVEEMALQDAKKYYEENKNEFERLKLAHIMIRFAALEEIQAAKKAKNKGGVFHTEEEALKLANSIYDRLQKGESFETLAKELSEDVLTKDHGGFVGSVSKNDPKFTRRGFKPLLDKAFEMKVGEIGGPIKTTSGYHILTVTAPAELAPFEEAQNQILFKTRGDVRQKLLEEMKGQRKIVYAKELEGPKPPPPPPDHQ